jgi:uncharacterized membrane protein YkoI
MSPGSDGRFEIVCPCCDTRLVVDAATGVILSEDRPKKAPLKSFDQAVAEVRGAKEKADKDFTNRLDQAKHEKEILAKKFEEAMKKAEKNKDEKPPPRPFEFD